ncbi:MAG: ATP-binding protein [Candidatus Cloacimonadales bacterium]|jgi:signal transduction histidine kinase/ActR/RegA family two-component response regulator|nr:response regulator [Candidatus Cloacimonadota bacterium]MDD2649856.1 ATP-binding protein [Candidatus Cloacimonadota bacterium]MDD3501945.1 ATP-binding protein [Candidatus Cloacimonadota bacterium]MDX9977181.1 ATP-binding protein [Candidatus Cloacimonadales bacterium]
MTDKIYFLACSHCRDEVNEIINKLQHFTLTPLFYEPICVNKNTGEKIYKHLLNYIPDNSLTIAFAEYPQEVCEEMSAGKTIVWIKETSCFELLLNSELVSNYMAKDYYLITPGRLKKWREIQKIWGFDDQTHREFFQESAKKILLLDTGVDQNAMRNLQEFAESVGLEYEVLPVGLTHFQNIIEKTISQKLLQSTKLSYDKTIVEVQHTSSNMMMMMNVLSDISRYTEEDHAIEELINLMQILFSPKFVYWIKIKDDEIVNVLGTNSSKLAKEKALEIMEFVTKSSIDYETDSFYLRIGHSEVRAIVLVEKIYMKEYLTRYYNIALELAGIANTIIKNCRSNKTIIKQKEKISSALDTAKLALKAKSHFFAVMNHELRTPMNSIIGFSDLLKMTDLNNKQKSFLRNIEIAAQNMLDLINDMLDFSKIEAGKFTIDLVTANLLDILNNCIFMMKPQIETKGIKFVVDIQKDMPVIGKFDPLRLHQILMNLLANAKKFTEQGTIKLKITAEILNDKEIIYHFYTSDTGIGISEENQKKLFTAFTQADDSVSRRFGGTGLGLSISKTLVELMGGKISVESSYGKGSTFYFYIKTVHIPFDDVELDKLHIMHTKKDAIIYLDAYKILMVDDSAMNNLLLKQVLLRYLPNAIFVEASNGLQAVEAAQKDRFDIIFMDILMPEMDGLEATKQIRKIEKQNKENYRSTIIALTASDADKSRFKRVGIDNFLNKPIDARKLKELLKVYIGTKN